MTTQQPWVEANQAALLREVGELRLLLERAADHQAVPPAAAEATQTFALDAVCAAFALSSFERRLLLLCAAVELDGGFPGLLAAAQGDPGRPYPTFGLALALLPDAHWSALTPASPLRLWQLIELDPGDSLVSRPLRIDERILHFLAGVSYLDERLRPLIHPVEAAPMLAPSHAGIAGQIVARWSTGEGDPATIQLCGAEQTASRGIAAAACEALGAPLLAVRVGELPRAPAERETLRRLWQREWALGRCALLIDCHDAEAEALRVAASLVEGLRGAIVVTGREPLRLRGTARLRFDVPALTAPEQADLWRGALGEAANDLNGQVPSVVEHFQFGVEGIRVASAAVLARLGDESRQREHAGRILWDACRAHARPRLDDLAQRIEPAAEWGDLVLPAAQIEVLRQIAEHVADRATVYGRWGFGGRGRRGLGISALFSGASGTGKTMAAEVLAAEMGLDLYRIDLSQVVSKYIGETEKNLARVFDAAEAGGVILLFDEADALFGKRGEVRDSHDRYANIEVSYLLQRMEAYRGLAILTTNMKSALDPAFLRRIRFVVQFPFPDAVQRAAIWRSIFPAATPTEALNLTGLARLNVAGGSIRNIALNAAFIAAGAGEPVRMVHLLRAARAEYAKLEKPLTDTEVAGWL